MTRFRTLALMTLASVALSACMGEGIDADSTDGLITITHTTKGTLYWE